MRALAFLVPVVLAVALVPAAAAKGPVEICGKSACAMLASETEAGPYVGPSTGATRVAPSAPAPYFALRFAGFPGTLSYWIPSAHALRYDSGRVTWVETTPQQQTVLAHAAKGLAPRAAPTKLYVTVDGVMVRRPTGWLSLFTIGTPATSRVRGPWRVVVVGGPTLSPWTDGADTFRIARRAPYLERDGRLFRIPAAIARKIRARKPLA